MSLQIIEKKPEAAQKTLDAAGHALVLMPKGKTLAEVPGKPALAAALKRKDMKAEELAKSPLAIETGAGLRVYAMLDAAADTFSRHAQLRQALAPLLAEHPGELQLALYGPDAFKQMAASDAVYCAAVNAQPLPTQKSGKLPGALQKLAVHGVTAKGGYARELAVAEGNTLTRALTSLPPNQLTPGAYRKRIARLAKDYGWKLEELGFDKLKKMGAGAFCAVAQGSPAKDAAIVHLKWEGGRGKGEGKKKKIALVGKGICFDTGGHNLKPAKYMHGMHEDMNGSAVVLGIMAAASRLKLPLQIDGWVALAENHISPQAYRQNEIVRSLNGTTIEIVHTDAEGRMVLADTLTMAARAKPDAIADFATLTGSMHYALGDRYSGIFSNRENVAEAALKAAQQSGERVCRFPMDADYDPQLDSKVADVLQCTMEGAADHILATRFLSRFIDDTPWVHMDLSASTCKGGLGAVMTDLTGFGVGWGVAWVEAVGK
ncbi:leucyl aminopeptidase family protein [Betaproteobacteria bacterium SCN2]|jgi:leucyl aminopeptidase|nr:leucyl aminopeptidase family protein [Betaproteobacteria bacterium SCN2]